MNKQLSFDKQGLSRKALDAAQRVRTKTSRPLLYPLCIYDVTTEMRVDLWFQQNSSLEGMYAHTPKSHIIIGSERPSPRQRYTCAHELGHHIFGHGTRIDLFSPDVDSASNWDPDEFIVQAFAGFLLMPKLAIANAFHERGWKVSEPSPEQVYRISNLFGTGYETLIKHMSFSLGLITSEQRDILLSKQPKSIRSQLVGKEEAQRQLFIVDDKWRGRPVDVEVGDLILSPPECELEGDNLQYVRELDGGRLWESLSPGRCRLLISGNETWASFVRVSRKHFQGRGIFRHLEEPYENE